MDRLRYQRLIITDALEMDSIAHRYGDPRAAGLAAQAGADVLLTLTGLAEIREVHRALLEAARSGELAAWEVESTSLRLAAAKQKALIMGLTRAATGGKEKEIGAEELERIAREAITLVRDRSGLLPLRLDRSVRLAVLDLHAHRWSPVAEASSVGQLLSSVLAERHSTLRDLSLRGPDPISEHAVASLLEWGDVTLVATRGAYPEPWQANVVRRALAAGKPTMLAALGIPYDLMSFPQADCYLAAYGDQPCLLRALAEVVFGEILPVGRLPVTLPDLYPAGHQANAPLKAEAHR